MNKSLELLQKELYEKAQEARDFSGSAQVISRYDTEKLINHTYETAIKDCLEALPGEFWTNYEFDPEYRDGWNKFRSEIKAKLESLLPNNK